LLGPRRQRAFGAARTELAGRTDWGVATDGSDVLRIDMASAFPTTPWWYVRYRDCNS